MIHFGVNGFSDLPVSSETAAIFSFEWVKNQDFLGCTSAGYMNGGAKCLNVASYRFTFTSYLKPV